MRLQELNAESFKLYGRMAVITGAASGIGRAIAHKFAANGASVCLLDVDRKHAEADYQTNTEAKKEIEGLMTALHKIDVDKLDKIIELLEKSAK